MMKNLFLIFSAFMTALAFHSCGEPADPVVPDEPEKESLLTLEADKETIYANGADAVTFTVRKDGADVTAQAQITLDGLGLSSNTFTTSKPGKYAFKASYEGLEAAAKIVEAIEMEVVESRFDKHVAVWEFTGAWCTFCPSGYSTMNFIVSKNDRYKDNVHLMAFHSGLSGQDELAIPETDEIMSDMNVGDGFPSFLTDMRTSGGLSDGTAFRASLTEAFGEYPAHCGVAVSSTVDGTDVSAVVKVFPEMSLPYRLAVFIVEDNIKYYQKDGSITHDEYNHRHVVRKIISASYLGDRLGDLKAGEEVTKTYGFKADAAWNLDNTYIYALAIDYNGHVNNMNYCKIGAENDYDRL